MSIAPRLARGRDVHDAADDDRSCLEARRHPRLNERHQAERLHGVRCYLPPARRLRCRVASARFRRPSAGLAAIGAMTSNMSRLGRSPFAYRSRRERGICSSHAALAYDDLAILCIECGFLSRCATGTTSSCPCLSPAAGTLRRNLVGHRLTLRCKVTVSPPQATGMGSDHARRDYHEREQPVGDATRPAAGGGSDAKRCREQSIHISACGRLLTPDSTMSIACGRISRRGALGARWRAIPATLGWPLVLRNRLS